jgi:hypothetical protein
MEEGRWRCGWVRRERSRVRRWDAVRGWVRRMLRVRGWEGCGEDMVRGNFGVCIDEEGNSGW